jgi:hypothetical protein
MTIMTSEQKEKVVNDGNVGGFMVVKKNHEKCKLKWLISLQICTTIIIVLVIGTFYLVGYPIRKEREVITNITQVLTNITQNNSTQKDNIATLYALDPLARAFCFDDGGYGQTFSDWSVYNRCSDIDFNTYNNGNFTVGIEGGRVGTIINLGSSADLQKKYKYQETMGNGQGFASIHRKNKTILILKDIAYNHTFQPMEESDALFRERRSEASVSVNLGHLYILRITDRSEPAFERIVKMLVIAYKPNESVTIRWEVLV